MTSLRAQVENFKEGNINTVLKMEECYPALNMV